MRLLFTSLFNFEDRLSYWFHFFPGILPHIPQNPICNTAPSKECIGENGVAKHTIEKNFAFFPDEKCEPSKFPGIFKSSNILEEIKLTPVPVEIEPTIFIQHAKSDTGIAERLSTQLTSRGVIAKTLNEIKDRIDADPKVIDAEFKQVSTF